MPNKQAYLDQIKTHYLDLEIHTAEFNKDGQYNDVLIINGTHVFRFAKVEPAVRTLRQEIEILTKIKDSISVSVPDPIYSKADSELIGEVFMGYQMIPGRPLWKEIFQSITAQEQRESLAAQLAGFLKELHASPVLETFPIRDSAADWQDMYQRIQEKLFPQMRPDARHQISAHFESYLNSPEGFKPCLRHGDFGTGNILVDYADRSLTGVIDFGFAGIGDPATDFAGLLICYGEEFYQCCAKHYAEMKTALPRARFYIGTFALQEALFGIENDDAEALKAGMANYI